MKTKTYKLSTILIITLVNLLIGSSVFAQAFEKISYQAVIRDTNGNLVTNQTIGMQVHILVGYGTAYIETHTPTTNANGLVSIEVGGGTLVSGMWSMIYWEYGDCSIKTEIDPTGGTNYTITATSQLLSVPFTIHAKTAITADTAEVAHIAENVIVYTAGTGIDITNSVISATSISTTYSVGDFAQGGVVFWVDETGEHGLVCAKKENSGQGGAYRWSYGSSWYTPSFGNGPYSGEMNTFLIIAHVGEGTALLYAAEYSGWVTMTEGGKQYGDWYLPSRIELGLMYDNKAIINTTALANGGSAFTSDFYWSSNPHTTNYKAWGRDFGTGQASYVDRADWHRVRAIRAF
jgi:hypothetical protein